MKNTIAEIRDRISRGYTGELLYNYRTGNYEIITWLSSVENPDSKIHKIPRGSCDSMTLKCLVYPDRRFDD